MAIFKRIYYTPKRSALQYILLYAVTYFFSPYVTASTLAVIYPDLPPPYQQVFEQILQGIEKQHKEKVIKYPIDKEIPPDQLLKKMEQDKINRVITLGRRGYFYNNALKGKFLFVTGALPIKPNGASGISLIADPNNLFQQLKRLSPNTHTVYAVHTKNSAWLIKKAQNAATDQQLKLLTAQVDNVSDAVKQYQQILQNANSQTDAIWVLLDPITANDNVILPLLLRESWDKNFVVFSSKPGHVRRGFLFTLFPDHIQDGTRLAAMVAGMRKEQKGPGVELSLTQRVGVNLRTASHLGFEYSNQMKNSFYQTFPKAGF